VRASSVITWVRAAWVIQVLLPVTRQSSPSRHGPGAQRAQVRAGIGFGEHRRRQHLARWRSGQPLGLLRLGPAAQDQLGGDLGSGAQAADADIAARQLLGDHAHRRLGQAKAAMFLGDRQAEHAQLGHLGDDLHRDQLVLEVPFMGMRRDPLVGEAAELVADHLQLFVKAGGAETRHPLLLFQQLRQPHPRRGGIALAAQSGHFGRVEQGGIHAQIGRAHDLALAHRQAAGKLGDVFAKGDLVDQRLDLAEPALGRQPLGPALHLAQALGIGRDPGQAMGGILMRLDQPAADPVALGDLRAHRRSRRPGIGLDGAKRRPGQVEQSRQQGACGIGGAVLSVMRHGAAPFLGECCAAYRMLADAAQSSHPRGGRHER
jgi:hypothetical protein